MDSGIFNTEVAYFEQHREDFVREALGRFVVVKGKEHFGFYETEEEAYRAGVELLGLKPFLIKQVLVEDQIHEIPAYYLGLLDAVV